MATITSNLNNETAMSLSQSMDSVNAVEEEVSEIAFFCFLIDVFVFHYIFTRRHEILERSGRRCVGRL